MGFGRRTSARTHRFPGHRSGSLASDLRGTIRNVLPHISLRESLLRIIRHATSFMQPVGRGSKYDAAIRNFLVNSSASLLVGSVVVRRLSDGIGNELMAVFRDDMLRVRSIPEHQYLRERRGRDPTEASSEEMDVIEFRALGQVIAARLDVMGIDATIVLAGLDEQLSHPRLPFDEDMVSDEDCAELDRANEWRMSHGAHRWVELLAASPEGPSWTWGLGIGSRKWLMEELADLDVRYALRAALLAFPDAEVVLDITGLEKSGYLDESERECLASEAAAAIGEVAGRHAPVVVLTEGRTDAEFLAAGLAVLYPYLTDLIRFLDYERKPEGGVGALVRMVRAFASAGIVNRVVAVCDNDTAAADGLRTISSANLPAQIKIARYPVLDLAKAYPTLGPPNVESLRESASLADVNGLACSIELYLGRDVLTRPDGTLRPVQWTSFIASMARYQGEVTDKKIIHQAFRAKYALALEDPENVKKQDWSGLRLILDVICASAQSAFGNPTSP
jgi:hypothetical protein